MKSLKICLIVSSHTKCVSLSNQKYEIQPILINLHPYEYSKELHYCFLAFKLEDVLKVVMLLMKYLIKYTIVANVIFLVILGQPKTYYFSFSISELGFCHQ